MTDTVKGFTVTLENDIRIDDVQSIMEAIKMIKGIVHVEPSLSGTDDIINSMRIKTELKRKFIEFIKTNL